MQKTVPLGTDPTSPPARADLNSDDIVNIQDTTIIGSNGNKVWTNTQPP